MEIEETVVHRFQRQRETKSSTGLGGGGGSAILPYLAFHLCETCHRAYGHRPGSLSFGYHFCNVHICELQFVQSAVRAYLLHQLVVRTGFGDAPVVDDHNTVGAAHR